MFTESNDKHSHDTKHKSVLYPQRAHTCTENVLKTRFQDVRNFNLEDVHKT